MVAVTQEGCAGVRRIKRANILLLANAGKVDIELAELLHSSWLTLLRTQDRYVEGGLEFALNGLPRAGRRPKIDEKIETILTTLADGQLLKSSRRLINVMYYMQIATAGLQWKKEGGLYE